MKQKGRREQNPEGVQHRKTTRDERIKVITLREAGWNWTRIGNHLQIDRPTCQKVAILTKVPGSVLIKQVANREAGIKIYQRTQAAGTPSNGSRSGRPPIFDEEEKHRLEAFVTRDSYTRRLSWEAICIEMNYACSARTIKWVMHSMGYHRRVPQRKFAIRPAHRPIRVAWCQEQLDWTFDDWLRVLWTDESSFSTSGFGSRPWVTRKASEAYHEDCIHTTHVS